MSDTLHDSRLPSSDLKRRTRILCVDDEPHVLEGIALGLGRKFEVMTATSGTAGLEILGTHSGIVVIVSDMRMPGMDGSTFLARAREVAPDAIRILLTGQADLASAISAVNDGQIFRFLNKPCPPIVLITAIEAGVEQHRLITAERVLLEQTLHGSIKALTDILSLTNPISFGRATRIKQLVVDLAEHLGGRSTWQLEVAAMVSQLGFITLPQDTVEKIYYAQPLSDTEQTMLTKVPVITEQLLANIPRLEGVREILDVAAKSYARGDAAPNQHQTEGQMLRVALDYDALETQGGAASFAVDTMRGRTGQYDARVVQALSAVRGQGVDYDDVREVPLALLHAGMVFAEDVKMTNGSLLVSRGYEVTAGFVERLHNFRPGTVKEPVRVIVRSRKKGSASR